MLLLRVDVRFYIIYQDQHYCNTDVKTLNFLDSPLTVNRYFVVGNAIACAFAAVSLALTFISNGGGKIVSRLMIIVADLMMVALLFSSIGAATGIGLIGIKGNSHLQWHKVCDVFGRFCHQVMASVALSLLAAIAFLLLIILAASKLQKRTY